MAANFWTSTHLTWLMPKDRLELLQAPDRARGLSHEAITQLKVHFTQYIFDLANSTKLRQHVAATAVVYLRRFYAGTSFSAHDPRLMAPACLYLASKAEESVVAAKVLVATMKRLRPAWSYEVPQLLDAEMILLEHLDAKLVVYSPYLSLSALIGGNEALLELGQNAWAALNDAYRTDLLLVWPPYMIALGCLVLAAGVCGRDLAEWVATLDVNLDQVYDISLDMVDMYERHRVPISIDETTRLLAVLGRPASTAGGTAPRA